MGFLLYLCLVSVPSDFALHIRNIGHTCSLEDYALNLEFDQFLQGSSRILHRSIWTGREVLFLEMLLGVLRKGVVVLLLAMLSTM